MELTSQLEARNTSLSLQWRRRDRNQEADDLTNGLFDKFNPARKVVPTLGTWLVMDWLFEEAGLMYSNIAEQKAGSALPARKRRKGKAGL